MIGPTVAKQLCIFFSLHLRELTMMVWRQQPSPLPNRVRWGVAAEACRGKKTKQKDSSQWGNRYITFHFFMLPLKRWKPHLHLTLEVRKVAVDSSHWGWNQRRCYQLNRINNKGSNADSASKRGTSTSVDEDGNSCDIREVGGSKGRHIKSVRVTLCVSSSASLCRPWPRGRETWHTKASVSPKAAIFHFFFSRGTRVEDHKQPTACLEFSICFVVCISLQINTKKKQIKCFFFQILFIWSRFSDS